ncbi:hypothetical protein [Ruminococcus sp.]|uniref:hypothetical protein n=1 Tax=Ruminococcus sp. TaxID=41978 RepID=UPI00388F2642
MPQIKVNTHTMSSVSTKLKLSSALLLGQAAAVRQIGNHLPFSADISAQIKRALASCSDSMLLSRRRVIHMADALNQAGILYGQAEMRRCTAGMDPLELFRFWIAPLISPGFLDLIGKNPFISGAVIPVVAGIASNFHQTKSSFNEITGEGAFLDGSIDGGGSFFGLPFAVSAYGGIFYANGKAGIESGMKYKNGKLDFLGAVAGAEGEFSVLKGKVNGSFGTYYGEADASLLNVAAKGEVGATLFKDGKLNPQLYAELEAKANVAEGSLKVGRGTDALGTETEAQGEVLTASAKADAAIGKITVTDKNGKTTTHYGAKAEVGAEAYAAKGSISQSFNFLGIKFDASIGGGIGGAGASAGGAVTTDGVKGSFGLGLGLGADVSFGVDWSGFDPGKIGEAFDQAGKMIGETGKAFENVGKAVNGALDNAGKFLGGLFR